MDKLIVGAVQIACGDDLAANLDKIEHFVAEAARRGAALVVLQELIDGCYFCQDIDLDQRGRALPLAAHPAVSRLARLAAKLGVVLPVSVYEADGDRRFNTLVMVDADGAVLGAYRKSHIPNSRDIGRRATSPTATPASRSGTPGPARSAPASAGTSGFRKRRAPW